MCLAIVAERYFRIEFFGEYIFLKTTRHGLVVREVYDLFFETKQPWPGAYIRCISPHLLVKGGKLSVGSERFPGKLPDDKIVYDIGHGRDAKYESASREFRINVSVGEESNSGKDKMGPRPFWGEVLCPKPEIPDLLKNDHECEALMEGVGTIFDVQLGDLKGNHRYALRLVVQPHILIGQSPRYPSPNLPPGYPIPTWSQDLTIFGVRTCYTNCRELLSNEEKARQFGFLEALEKIKTVIMDNRLIPLPRDHHRILVISPPNAQIEEGEPVVGDVWCAGVHTYLDPSTGNRCRVAEWASGEKTYWPDDIEACARGIWIHMSEYGKAHPKTKEDVTSILRLDPDNCSLVMDALKEKGLLSQEGRNFKALGAIAGVNDECFIDISSDPHIIDKFRWMTYRICYTVWYIHLDTWFRAKLLWYRFKNWAAFWLAVLSVAGAFYCCNSGQEYSREETESATVPGKNMHSTETTDGTEHQEESPEQHEQRIESATDSQERKALER